MTLDLFPALRERPQGWFMHHHDLYPKVLGIPSGGKLPDEGFTKTLEDGTVILCTAVERVEGQRKSSKHRVFVRCTCDKLVPFGRLHQHLKGFAHTGVKLARRHR